MSGKALMVVGQKRFVQTMRKAGADMEDLKRVNKEAAQIALPSVKARAPFGQSGDLMRSIRIGATKKAGVIRAGSKATPYPGVINYGWPRRHIRGQFFANNGIKDSESRWTRLYEDFIKKTMQQVKGA